MLFLLKNYCGIKDIFDESIRSDISIEDEKSIIREIKKINRSKRSLVDIGGDTLYLVDHTDRDGFDSLKDGQEGYRYAATVDIKGISSEEIQAIKNEFKDGSQSKESLNRVLKSHGLESRYKDSNHIDAEDRKSNSDNVGLDKQTLQGESRRGQSAQNSPENRGTGQVRTGFDGTNGPRYTEEIEKFQTPKGELYGFVDKDGKMYLDETVISPEHPIREYTHLWDRAVRKKNPELWNRCCLCAENG